MGFYISFIAIKVLSFAVVLIFSTGVCVCRHRGDLLQFVRTKASTVPFLLSMLSYFYVRIQT